MTQTVRNFGGSLGLAVLGSLLITQITSKVEKTLGGFGVPKATADRIAHAASGASGGASGGAASASHALANVTHAVRADFASATKVVVIGMAAAMAAAFVVSFLGLPRGRAGDPVTVDVKPGTTGDQTAAPVG